MRIGEEMLESEKRREGTKYLPRRMGPRRGEDDDCKEVLRVHLRLELMSFEWFWSSCLCICCVQQRGCWRWALAGQKTDFKQEIQHSERVLRELMI